MCGITGFTSLIKNKEKILRNMNQKIHHRGPDEDGYFIDKDIALANKRLSIIALSSGKQPITCENYVILFNGEIYNYLKLKKDLLKKGYKFKTMSDTEVLLKMYIEYQENCLKYLDGMFVFAIWDTVTKKIFIARDRLGKKPLYYCFLSKQFIFGSEIKSILEYPGIVKKLNKKVLNSYFQYRYIVGNETFFENIYSLLPGHFLSFNVMDKKIEIKKYWELSIASRKKDLGERFYVAQTKKLLVNAIKKRMIGEVPIGAYLSGGLDSSIVASVMASIVGDKALSTFTIGFKEKDYNEFKYARLVADKWKTDHHEILLTTENYIKTMDYLIGFKDAPLAVPNEVPLYLMSKKLKKYITVVLSGEGADELFGGYGRIFRLYINFRGKSDENYLDFFLDNYNYVSDKDLQKFLDPEVLNLINKKKYTYNIFRNYFKKISHLNIEDKIPYIFENLHLQGLLQRLDTTTMAASVEGRAPFVDHELVEFVNEIPYKYKIKWKNNRLKKEALAQKLSSREISENYDITKYILRKSFRDYLPEEVLKRKKIGFPVPLDNWFKGKFVNYANEILLDKRTLNRKIFNKEYLESGKFIDELSGINIWMLINLELFLRKYFD